jgi:hypothetical protein
VAAKTANEYIKNNSVNIGDCKSCIKLVWKAATDAAEALKPSHNIPSMPCSRRNCVKCVYLPCMSCKDRDHFIPA